MNTEKEFPIQLSVKHEMAGIMWNLRGPDVATVMGHFNDMVSFASTVSAGVAQLYSVEALTQGGFSVTPVEATPYDEPVPQPMSGPLRPEQMAIGQKIPCPVNPRAVHERRSGTSKDNKRWDGVLCNNQPTKCAAVWL